MEANTTSEKKDTIPFFPDHITTEFIVAVGIFGLVLLIGLVGLFSPVGLQAPADPLVTPDHVKPEWYFLALYQILKFIPKTIGATLPVLLILLIFVWPFVDSKNDNQKAMRRRWIFVIVASVIIIALTIWGEVS